MLLDGPEAVALRGVSKKYGSTRALESVDFSVRKGEIHGLVGFNGSGKSTLAKILSGAVTPEPGGRCILWGSDHALPLRLAVKHGIATVPQTLGLDKTLTVLDNVNIGGVLARESGSRTWALRRRSEADRLRALLTELGWTLDPMTEVGQLSPGEQAIVAIVRAFASTQLRQPSSHESPGSRLACIILDEPTAYLTADDTARLFRALRRLVSHGNSAILISHRMADIFSVCERVTVLREGRVVAAESLDRTSVRSLTALMAGARTPVGAPSTSMVGRRQSPAGESSNVETIKPRAAFDQPVLVVRGLSAGRLRDFRLDGHRGEVVGCTGLIGSGIDELSYAIVGAIPRTGEVRINGQRIYRGPSEARRKGLVLVPADRADQALWSEGSLEENLCLTATGGGRRHMLYMSRRRYREAVKSTLEDYAVVARGPADKISELSGGNQQKLVVARALGAIGLKVLVLHEPTSGVDVGARASIYAMIKAHAERGLSVIVCSSDIEEIVQISDRIIIMVDGVAQDTFAGRSISVEAVALAASQGRTAENMEGDEASRWKP
jgi:ribose transport system ATP-binding protein